MYDKDSRYMSAVLDKTLRMTRESSMNTKLPVIDVGTFYQTRLAILFEMRSIENHTLHE
ncbi:hypothetical protein CHS0354_005512, partial [Potamilus streckersoni]